MNLLFALLAFDATGEDKPTEHKYAYVRPAGKAFAAEADFTLTLHKGSWLIRSDTGRGATRLHVAASYDAKDRLSEASAFLFQKDVKTWADVKVAAGKAKVTRNDKTAQEFDVPPGVIVTSAPDWTDIFLLCRRYDRKRGGKQETAGLWIHPVQPAQLLTFKIELEAREKLELGDKAVELDRFRIHIRGPNPYLAWADTDGTLVKLMALPVKDGAAASGLIRAGYEALWSKLNP